MSQPSGETSGEQPPRPTLRELAWVFLKLGFTAFGGPAAHVAMMEDEVVTKRRWLSRQKFLDLLAASNLIPGPNSTELAIHIGLLAGWRGFVVAGACFILPAAVLTGLLAWAYVRYGSLPDVAGLLYGVKPVLIAVVAQALIRFGRDSLTSILLVAVALAAVALALAGVHELLVLLAGGLVVMLGRGVVRARQPSQQQTPSPPSFLPVLWAGGAGMAGAAAVPFGLWPLFLFFLKVGSVLFGSGYVLLAFLRADLVERYGWLTEQQLLDAIAAGQLTPGPVFTTATFIGYVLGGVPGAVVATLGIFLPAFFFVAVSGPIVPRLRNSVLAGGFLDGVVGASLALMAVVTWQLARAAFVDWLAVALAVVSAAILFRWRINSAWLVLGGAAVGWVATWLGWRA
jgi:chromate transporter